MIIYGGETYDSSEQNRLLDELGRKIPATLQNSTLSPETVIDAVDKLRLDTLAGRFDDLLASFPEETVETYKAQAAVLLSREHLRSKLATELGNTDEYTTDKREGFRQIKVRRYPLGVILHIAAGNMDFLPAYSLAEGLLTGNINILKLPSADNGLSVKLIMELIGYQPELKDYIYVFDTPSSDIQGIMKMAQLANGISVWGSDAAVDAVRKLAPSGVKLIEWGQKLGFCYVSDIDSVEDPDKELQGLAQHIASTKQLLCSSCQVIYVDTDDMAEVRRFAERFLPFLLKETGSRSNEDIGIRARDTLVSYTQKLKGYLGKSDKTNDNILSGNGASLILSADSKLELSPMMCNVLVKPLHKTGISAALFDSKNYLQTAGLICPAKDREELTDILLRCGINRVTTAADMSGYFPGESHDGEYALSRYTRTVNIEV